MKKIILAASVLAFAMLLTGCASAPVDDFADYEFVEPPTLEGVTAQAELTEYDGNTEKIIIMLTNDRDERFFFGESFVLQKRDNDKWRPLKIDGIIRDVSYAVLPRSAGAISVLLKDHVKLPLLPGQYRMWIGSMDDEKVSAEFTVK